MNNYLQFGTVIGVYNYPFTDVNEKLMNDTKKGHHLNYYQLSAPELLAEPSDWKLYNGIDSEGKPCKFLVTDEEQINEAKGLFNGDRINYLHANAEIRVIEYES